MSIKGELVTETLDYDGGREVTVYVPRPFRGGHRCRWLGVSGRLAVAGVAAPAAPVGLG